MNLSPELLTQLGPIGVFVLCILVVYFQLVPQAKRQHAENSGKLDDILKQLTTMNGRIGKVEEWRGGHEKQDDERERRHDGIHAGIHEELGRVRETAHTMRSELTMASLRAAVPSRKE